MRITLPGLPIGSEWSYWTGHALAREDSKIKDVVDKWQQPALYGPGLVDRYAWTLDARASVLRAIQIERPLRVEAV